MTRIDFPCPVRNKVPLNSTKMLGSLQVTSNVPLLANPSLRLPSDPRVPLLSRGIRTSGLNGNPQLARKSVAVKAGFLDFLAPAKPKKADPRTEDLVDSLLDAVDGTDGGAKANAKTKELIDQLVNTIAFNITVPDLVFVDSFVFMVVDFDFSTFSFWNSRMYFRLFQTDELETLRTKAPTKSPFFWGTFDVSLPCSFCPKKLQSITHHLFRVQVQYIFHLIGLGLLLLIPPVCGRACAAVRTWEEPPLESASQADCGAP